MPLTEINFDGLVGPSHNYAGLSIGNLASTRNAGQLSQPRRAALEGFGLPLDAALAIEAQSGPQTFGDAISGAARFAGGEGRGGAGAGV